MFVAHISLHLRWPWHIPNICSLTCHTTIMSLICYYYITSDLSDWVRVLRTTPPPHITIIRHVSKNNAVFEREVAQWLECGAFPMSLPTVRVSNPVWCKIFIEMSCFSPNNIGTLFRCRVFGQSTSLSNVSLRQKG